MAPSSRLVIVIVITWPLSSSHHKDLAQHPGYYTTGDAGVIDDDGYVSVLERMDDVINVAAHRLSAGNIEAVVKVRKTSSWPRSWANLSLL